MTATAAQPTLNDDDVIAFLKQRPQFFRDHPEVLELIAPPDRSEGGVVDFQRMMVERLRADKTQAQKLQRELIDTVRANIQNYSRIQTAVLVLLEAESFEEFIQILTQDLTAILDVDVIAVAIEATSKEVPFVHQAGVRLVKRGTVARWLADGDARLESSIDGEPELFGPGAGLVKSQALLRLEISEKTPAGLIAFGARVPETFSPDQGIEHVGFLAQVIERCFRFWIDLDA